MQNHITEADTWYRRGNAYRQQGDWKHALECYHQAMELNPASPAAKAKEMLDNILGYYCKDLLNP